MLTPFDWLRICHGGAEFLATMTLLQENVPEFEPWSPPPPFSALDGPCRRCRINRRRSATKHYCHFCARVRNQTRYFTERSRNCLLIWGHVNQLPRQVEQRLQAPDYKGMPVFSPDERHFLLAIHYKKLKDWLQELVFYHGPDIKGILLIFPTIAPGQRINMSDLLLNAVYKEGTVSWDRLYIKFFAKPFDLVFEYKKNREMFPTLSVSDFLTYLDMAGVFRNIIFPAEQKAIYDILSLKSPRERKFAWGRFMGQQEQNIKDLLLSWNIFNWSYGHLKFFYNLFNYVHYT